MVKLLVFTKKVVSLPLESGMNPTHRGGSRNKKRKRMKATDKQLGYITRLMGSTYVHEYDKLTIKSASALISAILAYKRPVLSGKRGADDSELSFVYENLCRAEQAAFGHTFANHS